MVEGGTAKKDLEFKSATYFHEQFVECIGIDRDKHIIGAVSQSTNVFRITNECCVHGQDLDWVTEHCHSEYRIDCFLSVVRVLDWICNKESREGHSNSFQGRAIATVSEYNANLAVALLGLQYRPVALLLGGGTHNRSHPNRLVEPNWLLQC